MKNKIICSADIGHLIYGNLDLLNLFKRIKKIDLDADGDDPIITFTFEDYDRSIQIRSEGRMFITTDTTKPIELLGEKGSKYEVTHTYVAEEDDKWEQKCCQDTDD